MAAAGAGGRSFREKTRDFEEQPEQWQPVSAHTSKATRKGARQHGSSTQTIYCHKESGETIVRHTVTDDRGNVVDDHLRPNYKPRPGDLA